MSDLEQDDISNDEESASNMSKAKKITQKIFKGIGYGLLAIGKFAGSVLDALDDD